MRHELTAIEIREISDKNGTDHDAGQRGVDDWRDRFDGMADARLPVHERALLGARMSAFATVDVIRRFNAIGACSPLFPARGEAPAIKVRLALAWDAFEGQVRAELHQSQRTMWQRLSDRANRSR